MNEKFITILGPTASGKTDLAIRLAEYYDGEIICADSRTIYRGLDIGTAKPTPEQRQQVHHYLLDLVNPDEQFNAKSFKKAAEQAMQRIWAAGKLPFLVGGSGMYIDAVLFDYKFRKPRLYPDVNLDGKSLSDLVKIATVKYPREIHDIDVKNRRRVEQLILKGPAKDDDRRVEKINSLVLGMDTNMAQIKQNIALRTSQMLNNGLVQETKILAKQWGQKNVLLQTTGYGAVMKYLAGAIDQADLQTQIEYDTLALAKKQKTWFARNHFIKWICDEHEAIELIDTYLNS